MEQQSTISSTLEKFSLIHNLPIEFSLQNRRVIKFTCPTIKELTSEINLKFLWVISFYQKRRKFK
jgi:hypothetical protein